MLWFKPQKKKKITVVVKTDMRYFYTNQSSFESLPWLKEEFLIGPPIGQPVERAAVGLLSYRRVVQSCPPTTPKCGRMWDIIYYSTIVFVWFVSASIQISLDWDNYYITIFNMSTNEPTGGGGGWVRRGSFVRSRWQIRVLQLTEP